MQDVGGISVSQTRGVSEQASRHVLIPCLASRCTDTFVFVNHDATAHSILAGTVQRARNFLPNCHHQKPELLMLLPVCCSMTSRD